MDPRALGPVEAALQRARLHLRGGRRRLRQGRVSGGVAALYDALTSAMEWYCAAPGRCPQPPPGERGGYAEDRARYAALVRGGVLDGAFDFEGFVLLTWRALDGELAAGDASGLLAGVESVLARLGVLPFDEGGLPPEDPGTI